ncbi:unnamed protein product, partial [Ectocarpus sp. 12 AP-2014]
LERTQAELQALREENLRLKQQLSHQTVSPTESEGIHKGASENTANNEAESPAAEVPAVESPVAEAPTVESSVAEPQAVEAQAVAKAVPVEKAAAAQTPETEAPEPPPAAVQLPSPNALLNTWYERYPKAFFKGHTKPLKVGIHQDLVEREEWPSKLIRRALANYVNLPRYIKAVRAGAERVDLDGLPAGTVDKEAASHAAEKRSDQQVSGKPVQRGSSAEKTDYNKQRKAQVAVNKPRPEGAKQPAPEQREPRKQLSMEDKLLGLQQKFKGG